MFATEGQSKSSVVVCFAIFTLSDSPLEIRS
jgi:hypothetical protein